MAATVACPCVFSVIDPIDVTAVQPTEEALETSHGYRGSWRVTAHRGRGK